jgi:pyruvate dehydrogenase kinase 2/3/4
MESRLAHRLRDMQTLPYVVVSNPHVSHVYELYYKAFETFRRVKEIKNVADNDAYCEVIQNMLNEHLTVIPRLSMGILECQGLMEPQEMDKFMNTLLRARISRRVIAEHHLALTDTFKSPDHPTSYVGTSSKLDPDVDFIGKVLLRCNAQEVLEHCGETAQQLAKNTGDDANDGRVPQIELQGHLEATFPYILSHLEYIIGELLRNAVQAVMERFKDKPDQMPPIKVLVCEAPQHVIFRISDQGGGISRDIMPYLWSFSKGPRRQRSLQNLLQVPKMAATMQELKSSKDAPTTEPRANASRDSSLGSLTSRPPNLRLGIGLPMSRVYAEYWAGSLELHSLEGYGADVFLQIPKLGNKNEQLTTRALMDSV